MKHLLLVFLLAATTLAQRHELRTARDLGAMADAYWVEGIELRLARSPQQQIDMDSFLDELHKPGSANYHRWLKPEEYADRFGATLADFDKLRRWLLTQGFRVSHEARSRSFLTVAGTSASVRKAFGAQLRRYEYAGKRHFAHDGIARVPDAFASMVLDIGGLHDFLPEPTLRQSPLPETTNAAGTHYMAPDDLAIIYNIRPVYQQGIDGSGQKIVVVGQSTIDMVDMQTFRKRHNLTPNDPEEILYAGSRDPGVTSSQGEANLDLQWTGAVARNAKIFYVYGINAFSAVAYAIDQNLAPIISASFSGGCELNNSFATMAYYRGLAQQANAQGITWVNSSGDGGPTACDPNGSKISQGGMAIRVPSGAPEITAVGGTELNDRGGTYWRTTNDANFASVLSYIPETPWNETGTLKALWSGGGGISVYHPRPAWQEGPGVGNGIYRKSPDVALAASGYNGYYVAYRGGGSIFSGTSAAAPAFAGILSLVLQATNQTAMGNANRLLYPLAQSNPEAFHDVVDGNIIVPCTADSPDCKGGVVGYAAGPGYDIATGLGSVDVERLIAAWPRQAATKSLVTLSSSKDPVYALPSATGNTWTYTLTLKEHAGVATTITTFSIDGDASYSSQIEAFFGSSLLKANSALSASLSSRTIATPVVRTFILGGRDESGQPWTQTLYLQFYGLAVTPVIGGVANGASFSQTFAPGAILSVFGTNLSNGTQAAGAVPLLTYTAGITANINGVAAPFYFVSPGQVNLQIPYSTVNGGARLTLSYPQGNAATFAFDVSATAPGIFIEAAGFTVPQTSCARNETCILFINGQGAVSPAIATGAAPSVTATLAQLPKPTAEVTMAIGDVSAKILFAGIPAGLVGVTQINFTVAAETPVGTQRVVVKVGDVESSAAKINVK